MLEYVDAWKARIEANGGNIPSNIGRDGTIGGEWGGKWYGGVFGWNSPDEGVRNYVLRGPPEAFGNALLLTGNQAYTQVLRAQVDNLTPRPKERTAGYYCRAITVRTDGTDFMTGSPGRPEASVTCGDVETDIYMWALEARDLDRLPKRGWIGYLTSGDAGYPFAAFQQGIQEISGAARLRADTSTYEFPHHSTRVAGMNPVSTTALINLTMGGNDPNGSGHGPLPLHTQVRHFDPGRRRAGLPEDVAALVERIAPASVTLALVNTSLFEYRTVTVQMGAYAEHQATSVIVGDRTFPIDAPYFTVRLAPGAGDTLTINVRRYAHQPTLAFPWDRGWMVKH